MNLSVREREVLGAMSECDVIGFHVLAQDFESRMPADELATTVDSLSSKGAVVVRRGNRSNTVSITSRGRLALQEGPHA